MGLISDRMKYLGLSGATDLFPVPVLRFCSPRTSRCPWVASPPHLSLLLLPCFPSPRWPRLHREHALTCPEPGPCVCLLFLLGCRPCPHTLAASEKEISLQANAASQPGPPRAFSYRVGLLAPSSLEPPSRTLAVPLHHHRPLQCFPPNLRDPSPKVNVSL